jgi:hypothetical protein
VDFLARVGPRQNTERLADLVGVRGVTPGKLLDQRALPRGCRLGCGWRAELVNPISLPAAALLEYNIERVRGDLARQAGAATPVARPSHLPAPARFASRLDRRFPKKVQRPCPEILAVGR